MIQSNPRDWSVLRNGSDTQRKVFEILSATRLFDTLRPFDPAHVGTIGNDLDVPGSDIDIICSCKDLEVLESLLQKTYGGRFTTESLQSISRGVPALVVTIATEIPIEVYAEATPTDQQFGLRHYLIACRILEIFGDAARTEIKTMKAQGIKTEPAFAQYLGLLGDPFIALLELERLTDDELTTRFKVRHSVFQKSCAI